jgi:hypothetical protein
MIMFIWGVACVIGAVFLILVFAAFLFSGVWAFFLLVLVIWGMWKLASKDWGISKMLTENDPHLNVPTADQKLPSQAHCDTPKTGRSALDPPRHF